MSRHSCRELGLCQVEGALLFDRQCPQPCAECELRVDPIIVDGVQIGAEVRATERRADLYAGDTAITPRHADGLTAALLFPFAPGAIERFQPRRTRWQRFVASGAGLFIAAAVIGLLAGFARGKGWL